MVNLSYRIEGMEWQLNLISDELIKEYILHDYTVPIGALPYIDAHTKGNVESNMLITICSLPHIGWVEVNLIADQ